MSGSYSILGLFLLFVCVESTEDMCSDGNRWIADDMNCSAFWMCKNGLKFKFMCPNNTVVNTDKQACIRKGSLLDRCTPRQGQMELTGSPAMHPESLSTRLCKSQNEETVPHPNNCEKYINCSALSSGDNGIRECPFPLLWSDQNERCERFDNVKCGDKFEPKAPCEYSANLCLNAHCVPCEVRFPDCKSLPDGLNPWKGRTGSTYFVVCKDERVVFLSQCSFDKPSSIIFDPVKRACVMTNNNN